MEKEKDKLSLPISSVVKLVKHNLDSKLSLSSELKSSVAKATAYVSYSAI